MLVFFSIVHILLCVFMMFVILLQPGKDAGMGAALGGGAATSAFGGRGAVTFLGKVTAGCAIAFFITSLGLSFVGFRASVAQGVVTEAPKPAESPAPAGAPAPEGAAVPGGAPSLEQAPPDPSAGKAAPPPGESKPTGLEAVPSDKLPTK